VYGECENWACLLGHSGVINDLKFNYDGSEIATCATDKSIFVWDLSTCERIKRIKGHKEFVNSIDLCKKTPSLICSGSDDNTVKLWDRRKRGEAMSFDSAYQVLSVAFNETGDQIISGGIDNDLKLWDIRKNALLYRLQGHADSVTGLSLSPDGNFVSSNSMDNTGKIYLNTFS
jgi:Prp8 binding protein